LKLHCRVLLYDYIIDENVRFILDEDHGKAFTIFDCEIVGFSWNSTKLKLKRSSGSSYAIIIMLSDMSFTVAHTRWFVRYIKSSFPRSLSLHGGFACATKPPPLFIIYYYRPRCPIVSLYFFYFYFHLFFFFYSAEQIGRDYERVNKQNNTV